MKALNLLIGMVLLIGMLGVSCSGAQKSESSKSNGENSQMEQAQNNQASESKAAEKPQYVISVTQEGVKLGDITIELYPDVAPKMCKHFDELVASKFYDGTAFHRVMPGFMIQGGDPNSKNKPKDTWGQGAPGQTTVPAEFSKISHKRGILSTARKGNDINSASSQFFIMHADSPYLDGQYTVFGQVLSGMEVVDKIANSPTEDANRPVKKIEMTIVKK